eukprot:COSAG02_NODE_45565_length_356_cov_0.599222_1_plen_22_part_10
MVTGVVRCYRAKDRKMRSPLLE